MILVDSPLGVDDYRGWVLSPPNNAYLHDEQSIIFLQWP